MEFVRTHGYFSDAPAISFQKREAVDGRLDDLCGPEIGAVMHQLSWEFDPFLPMMAVNVVDQAGRVQAMARAIPTGLGVNLSYATSRESEGKGLAFLATCMAIVKLDALFGVWGDDCLIHAQWRESNSSSGDLAMRLGLRPDFELDFLVKLKQGLTPYLGASAPAPGVVRACRLALHRAGQTVLLPAFRSCSGGTSREDVKDMRDLPDFVRPSAKLLGEAKTFAAYQQVWEHWAREPQNHSTMCTLLQICSGTILRDDSQDGFSPARALANVLNNAFTAQHDVCHPRQTNRVAQRERVAA